MAKRKRKSKKPVVTEFKVGDKVRVKHGITGVEYPDMPMGGWTGNISEIHEDGNYTVRWNDMYGTIPSRTPTSTNTGRQRIAIGRRTEPPGRIKSGVPVRPKRLTEQE